LPSRHPKLSFNRLPVAQFLSKKATRSFPSHIFPQSKFKAGSKSSHDLLNDPKLSKDVGLSAGTNDDDDYIEEATVGRTGDNPNDVASIRDKLSRKSKPSKAERHADRDDDDEDGDDYIDRWLENPLKDQGRFLFCFYFDRSIFGQFFFHFGRT
jgi:hypothetical protein